MRAQIFGVAGLALTMSACGGGVDSLAQLCVDEAAKRLTGQVYRLDEKALSDSKQMAADGNATFTAEVILKPGTSGEEKQTLDCTVAPPAGDVPGRVIGFRFTVSGSGLTN